MRLNAQKTGQQFMAKAVHHAHHGDQGGDRQHDAEERDDRNQGDAALLAARSKIAHPFRQAG
jgi:hypothetical protein